MGSHSHQIGHSQATDRLAPPHDPTSLASHSAIAPPQLPLVPTVHSNVTEACERIHSYYS